MDRFTEIQDIYFHVGIDIWSVCVIMEQQQRRTGKVIRTNFNDIELEILPYMNARSVLCCYVKRAKITDKDTLIRLGLTEKDLV